MEADVLRKAASHLPSGLGKRFAFSTSPTAPASDPKERDQDERPTEGVKISRSSGGHFFTIAGTLFGTAVYVGRGVLTRVPVAELLTDSDGDGTIVFNPRGGVPFRSLWLAVDLENGSVAFATPEGYVPDQRQLDMSTLRKDADGLFAALEIERTSVELLLVRPGQGAWILRAREGAPTDGDHVNDGRLTLLFDQAAPLGSGNAKAPNNLKAGDVLALLDPGQLELRILTIGK